MKTRLLACSMIAAAACAQAEPLQEFEAIVAKCSKTYSVQITEVGQVKDRWSKVVIEPATDVSYDVKKTDSLVSPFTAFLSMTISRSAATAPTKEEAEAAVVGADRPVIKQVHKINFAYQGGKWVATGGEDRVSFKRPPEEKFSKPDLFGVSKEALERPGSVLSRCL